MAKRKNRVSESSSDPTWYMDAIIYQIHVRTFQDGNGDGIGDFEGLTTQLDYVQSLGVTAIWLQPFYPSPLRDDGYDIADYRSIHPSYGRLGDFKRFLDAAHGRGLKVITELVLNHTSDQHVWFQAARRAAPGSTIRNRYVWSDTPDRYSHARIIFKDFEMSNWTWDPVAKAYYWHRFFSHQPDLNFEEPSVQRDLLRVVDFWLGMGVDGLRLDAVPYLYEREGTSCENLPETHAFLRRLRSHVDRRYSGRMLLAEANQWPEDAVAYFGQADECHMAFHFPLMPRMFLALRMEDRYPIIDILGQTPRAPDGCQWAVFLRNHDELTLEMVTDVERDVMRRHYAPDIRARINLGIRRRLAPLLGNDRRKIELMNALLLSLGGTPVIYYGDEIGMGDNVYLGDRNGVRTPMQWSTDRNAGFSRANEQQLYLPLIVDPAFHHQVVNVENQERDPTSLLAWTRRMIHLRRSHSAFGRGRTEFLHSDNPRVLTFTRKVDSECLLVVANLSRFGQPATVDLSAFAGARMVELVGGVEFPQVGPEPYRFTLGPHSYFWFRVISAAGPSSATTADLHVVAPTATKTGQQLGPSQLRVPSAVAAFTWSSLMIPPLRDEVASLMPQFLAMRRWYLENRRSPGAVKILDVLQINPSSVRAPLPPTDASSALLILAVDSAEREPAHHIIGLNLAVGSRAAWVRDHAPEQILAHLSFTDQDAVIHEDPADTLQAQALRATSLGQGHLTGLLGEIRGRPIRSHGSKSAHECRPGPEDPVTVPRTGHGRLIRYGNKAMLKVFRKLEAGVHPETELLNFLLQNSGCPMVPRPLGVLTYRSRSALTLELGLLESLVSYETTGWDLAHEWISSCAADPTSRDRVTTQVALLGRRVAELHGALSVATDEPEMCPELIDPTDRRSLLQSVRDAVVRVTSAVSSSVRGMSEDLAETARRFMAMERPLLDSVDRLRSRPAPGPRIRVHSDLMLGRILWTGLDYLFVDFEGDVSIPLTQRRLKRSPLWDVATLLRSLMAAGNDVAKTSGANGPLNLREAHAVVHDLSATLWSAYEVQARQTQLLTSTAANEVRWLGAFMIEGVCHDLLARLPYEPEVLAEAIMTLELTLSSGIGGP